MKNQTQSKLDNLIIKLFGNPGKIQELEPEPTINETINYIVSSIENNKKSLITIFIIIAVLRIIEKTL